MRALHPTIMRTDSGMGSKRLIFAVLLAVAVFGLCGRAHAQKFPERRIVRAGNSHYENGQYAESEIDYRRALEKAPGTAEAEFNLGNALYKQERYEEAGKVFSGLTGEGADNSLDRSRIHYNNGNALFKQRKLEEALEEYKKALRENPDDREAKFNLAYVRKLLEKDKQQQQNQDDNNDQDKQENQDNQDDRNDPQQDEQDSEGQQDEGGDESGEPQPDQSPRAGSISREEAEQMLEAIQYREDKTREKVDKEKAAAAEAPRSGKNW